MSLTQPSSQQRQKLTCHGCRSQGEGLIRMWHLTSQWPRRLRETLIVEVSWPLPHTQLVHQKVELLVPASGGAIHHAISAYEIPTLKKHDYLSASNSNLVVTISSSNSFRQLGWDLGSGGQRPKDHCGRSRETSSNGNVYLNDNDCGVQQLKDPKTSTRIITSLSVCSPSGIWHVGVRHDCSLKLVNHCSVKG